MKPDSTSSLLVVSSLLDNCITIDELLQSSLEKFVTQTLYSDPQVCFPSALVNRSCFDAFLMAQLSTAITISDDVSVADLICSHFGRIPINCEKTNRVH